MYLRYLRWKSDPQNIFPRFFKSHFLSGSKKENYQQQKNVAARKNRMFYFVSFFHHQKNVLIFSMPNSQVRNHSYWHERSALQLVTVRRLTGNDVSGPLFSPLPFFSSPFSIPFSSVATFFHRRSAWIKKLILQKMMGA